MLQLQQNSVLCRELKQTTGWDLFVRAVNELPLLYYLRSSRVFLIVTNFLRTPLQYHSHIAFVF